MVINFGPRRPSARSMFPAMEPADRGPDGNTVPEIFEALGQMAGAAAAREPASWQEQLADMPSDAEAMARADPANRDLALNAALETAYGAGKDVQFGDMAERAYARNEADLDAFEADWQNLRTSALDNLAPSWKPIAEAEFDRRKSHYVTRIAANIRTQVEGETNAGLRTAADAYTVRAAVAAHDDDAGELAETLRRFEAAISARTDLAPEEKAKARLDLQSGVATQVALGRFDRALKDKGLEGAAQYAADFASGAAGGGGKLAEAERAPIARALKAHLDDAREADAAAKAAATTQVKVESAKRLAAVEKSIGENTYGYADLERDTQAGMFEGHPDAPARLSKAIAKARQARAAKTEAAARGAEAVAAGRDLTADDAGQADVDALWKAEKEADPTLGAARAIEIARRTQILPAEAREQIVDALRFGTPKVQAGAARALVALIQAAPGVAGTLPLDVRKRGGVIAKALAQERDEETAARIADDLLGPAAAGAASEWQGLTPTLTPAADTAEEEPPPPAKPETEARPAGYPVAPTGTPAPWRKILQVMEGGEAEALQDLVELIPEDPDSAADELQQALVELGLSFLPGVGNLLSAAQTYRAIVAAYKALKDDNLAKALEHGGDAAINAIGTIPGLGNLAKAGVRGVEATQAMVKVLRGKKAIAATQATTRVGSSVADTAFAHWVRNLFGGTTRAVGKTEKVGSLRPEVGTFLEAKGIKVQTDGIEAIDYKIRRMERKGKPSEKHAPRDVIESIPEVLRNPDEILWDGEALLYVRHLKGNNIVKNINPTDDRNRVKFVVNVNCRAKVQSDDGKIERLGNWVWSATRIPAHNLDVLERVWP